MREAIGVLFSASDILKCNAEILKNIFHSTYVCRNKSATFRTCSSRVARIILKEKKTNVKRTVFIKIILYLTFCGVHVILKAFNFQFIHRKGKSLKECVMAKAEVGNLN